MSKSSSASSSRMGRWPFRSNKVMEKYFHLTLSESQIRHLLYRLDDSEESRLAEELWDISLVELRQKLERVLEN